MTVYSLPIQLVGMAGSTAMIILSLLCIRQTFRLVRQTPDNVVWTYLFWLSCCLGIFAVSRSGGHILKQMFIMSGLSPTWRGLQPYSGTLNTALLIMAASVTLFFNRIWKIYQQIASDRQALQTAHAELLELNETLENRVKERTDALVRHEKQMAHADRLASIGQLSSGIAHEINNPLGIIQGYTQLLLRDENPDTQRYNDLNTILKHAGNCKAIVEDLLNFARRSKPTAELVQIKDLIEDALVFLEHRSQKDNIAIYRNYADDVPALRIDEKKMKQVLINLMMNAKHAVGQKGWVSIYADYESENDRVCIRIRDSGYGIDPKHIKRIFDPFFTTKPTGEGTGLGLAVSYGIVKSHGGEIEVESTPGSGTEFRVLLPVKELYYNQ
ncbi:MAG: ATP-binding protein [Desulfosalsimonadaceae bacterium]